MADVCSLPQVRISRVGYLSEAALRRGYQYSWALRWIRFLHGMCLHEHGYRNTGLAWKIGFSDPAGWTRFVRTLTGTVPSRLPARPLEYWVRVAIEDAFGAAKMRQKSRETTRNVVK